MKFSDSKCESIEFGVLSIGGGRAQRGQVGMVTRGDALARGDMLAS